MPEKSLISFGRYLKSARLEKAIDLKMVSSRTRIGADTLRAIEEEDHGRLPAEVFVKGFLRAYAREIDADGDEAVARYAASREMMAAAGRVASDRIRSSARFWPKLAATLAGFVLIVAVSVAVLAPHGEAPAPAPEAPPAVTAAPGPKAPSAPAPEEKRLPPPAVVKEPVAVPVEEEPPPVAAASHRLKIQAVNETWLKVIVDNLTSREVTLRPGDRLELEARSGFNLLIGNAAGITVSLDGKPIPVPGKSGQVVSLQLP